jgi:hypothetical protein
MLGGLIFLADYIVHHNVVLVIPYHTIHFKGPSNVLRPECFVKILCSDYLTSSLSNLDIIKKNAYFNDLRIFVPEVITPIFIFFLCDECLQIRTF